MIHNVFDIKKPLTEKEKDMLEALAERPVTPDETCREPTTEELACFRPCVDFLRKP